jgi:phosphopantetheine adenylyltransferase
LASLRPSPVAVLDIVVSCPALYGQLEKPRSQLFKETENLLAQLYSMISVICAQKNIELDSPGGINPRILLVEYEASESLYEEQNPPSSILASGPIIDFNTFALTRRSWQYIFCVEGEQGQQVFRRYSAIVNAKSPSLRGQIRKVPGGITMVSKTEPISETPATSSNKHLVVAVGGTFDHLHSGHKLLLTATALILQPSTAVERTPRRLIVGITGDELLKNKKYAEQLESWKQREESVVNFLIPLLSFTIDDNDIERTFVNEPVVNGRGVFTRLKQAAITIECVEIQDPFGPTITDETVSALVVSGETRDGGAAVNTKRQEQGWKPLEVFEIDVLDAEEDSESANKGDNFAAKISSTAIRKKKAEETHKPLL